MANSGELNVDLRLQLTKLRQDIAVASRIIKEGLGKSFGSGTGTGGGVAGDVTKGAGVAMDNLHVKVRKVNTSLQDQLAAWRKLHAGGIAPGMQIAIAPPRASAGAGGWRPGQAVVMTGAGLATRGPYTGATPPIIPSVSGGGGGGMGGSGLPWGRAITVFSLLYGSLALLRAELRTLSAAVNRASQLYAKSLSTGLSPTFANQRGAMARILGVGEQEVFQFGAAVQQLGPRLRSASNIMAETLPNLQSLHMQWGVFKEDLLSMVAKLASDATPALRRIVAVMDRFVLGINCLLTTLEKHKTLLAFSSWLSTVGTLATKLGIGGKGADMGAAAPPTSFMKQLPASALERMGLVISGTGGRNPQEETARNTKKIYEGVYRLVQVMQPRSGQPIFSNAYPQP